MAYFAKLDEDNTVLEVHVVANAALDLNNEEQSGIEFLTAWSGGHTKWAKTSYNASINGFRKNYAGPGYKYDSLRDAFIPPKPFNSWTLNESTCRWDAPVPYPTIDPDNPKRYQWNENILNWEEI